MKKSDLQNMIREIVKEEIREYVPIIVPLIVSEVVDFKLKNSVNESTVSPSKKKKRLKESVDTEEWPTLGGKGKVFSSTNIAELLGYGDMRRAGEQEKIPIVVSAIHPETGMEIPVDPNSMPDHLVNALTRDYSDIIKKMNNKRV
jgi:hypothetical protein